jgi:hypothetical protein
MQGLTAIKKEFPHIMGDKEQYLWDMVLNVR